MTWCGPLRGCLAVKFDSCNSLLSSVHTLLVNILWYVSQIVYWTKILVCAFTYWQIKWTPCTSKTEKYTEKERGEEAAVLRMMIPTTEFGFLQLDPASPAQVGNTMQLKFSGDQADSAPRDHYRAKRPICRMAWGMKDWWDLSDQPVVRKSKNVLPDAG